MRNYSAKTTESTSASALHELIIQPLQATGEHDPEEELYFSASSETSCLISAPPSQTPTVTGSLSDQSFDSVPIALPVNCCVAERVPLCVGEPQEQSCMCESSLGSEAEGTDDILDSECDIDGSSKGSSFLLFRMSYLFVTLVVMLADGLQGTNLHDRS